MEATCRRALELGLPGIAFTDHADFVEGVYRDLRPLEVDAYRAEVERCRALFPGLRVLSGVELGEPHRFPKRVAAVRAAGPLDRVLGSVHAFPWEGGFAEPSLLLPGLALSRQAAAVRAYLAETLALAESGADFEVLAHLEYFKRFWPHERLPYRAEDFEPELRAVLAALAARGSALEVNTTRGGDPVSALGPGPAVLRWWVEAGGRAVSFGSDAHDPAMIGLGFAAAAGMVEAGGFRPNPDPTGFWLR
ncbi:MAG: PHP domain-containing protein [Candidatus Dormibacteraeota bacterium]|nr:PHP domain-containing protein [Candidatus Dormibacteraeota bacterium]